MGVSGGQWQTNTRIISSFHLLATEYCFLFHERAPERVAHLLPTHCLAALVLPCRSLARRRVVAAAAFALDWIRASFTPHATLGQKGSAMVVVHPGEHRFDTFRLLASQVDTLLLVVSQIVQTTAPTFGDALWIGEVELCAVAETCSCACTTTRTRGREREE